MLRKLFRAPVILLAAGLCLGAYSLTFTHVAGSLGGPGYEDGFGSAARFKGDAGIAVDASGNVYVSDSSNSTIRKITPAGDVTTLAGLAENPGLTFSARGAHARFSTPRGLAVDGSGNIYVADSGNHMIKMISPDGHTSYVAGTGSPGNANGLYYQASFNTPTALTFDSGGNLYILEAGNNDIRVMDTSGNVTTFATGFNSPYGIVFHAGTSALYVADTFNNAIKRVTVPGGVVTTFAGTVGSPGHINDIGVNARFTNPAGICVSSGGTFYIADFGDDTIRTMDTSANVGSLAGAAPYPGPDDGTGSNARFNAPFAVAVDSSNNVYVADTSNNTVRKIVGTTVSTLAGLATKHGFSNLTGSSATFGWITGLSYYPAPVGSGATIFVADATNNAIRQISYDAGAVSTLAGGTFGNQDGTGTAAQFNSPRGLYFELNTDTIFVADAGNNLIRQVDLGGGTTLFAGQRGGSPGAANGDRLTTATFNFPTAIVGDPSTGDLYVADSNNALVRKITRSSGQVSTLAGGGPCCDINANGTNASFSAPLSSIAIDAFKNIYVTESQGFVVRKITPAGDVTTVAGHCCSVIPIDGNGTAAAFGYPGPQSIALDPAGTTGFVADGLGQAVRTIDVSGSVPVGTAGGLFNSSGTADGTGSVARFNNPSVATMFGTTGVFVGEDNAVLVGRPAIADIATIDSPTGQIGTARQLDTSPQTATSWQWSIIRRPSGSTATLSSSTVRNPTFTPDVPDLYVFKLVATSASGVRITTVSLQGNGPASYIGIAYPGPIAGVPFANTFYAYDADSNIADGYTGTLHFTTSDTNGTMPADYTFQLADHGVHTVSGFVLRTAGGQTITARDTVNTSISGTTFAFVTAGPASSATMSIPASLRFGAPTATTITMRDAYNNVATQYTGMVHFSSSDLSATLPSDYTFNSSDQGVHTFSGASAVTLRSFGAQSVTATDTVNGSLTASANVWVTEFGSDFNDDGYSDLLLQNSSGAIAAWLMNGTTIASGAIVATPAPTWIAKATGDINGDGFADIILQNSSTGAVAVWFMNGTHLTSGVTVATPAAGWSVVGAGDFNGDGRADIILQHTTGTIAEWQMNSNGSILAGMVVASPASSWAVKSIADFNGDGKSDILLQNTSTGAVAVWLMNGATIATGAVIASPATAWMVRAAGDADGDGKADIFLQNTSTGDVAEWKMNGVTITAGALVASPGLSWTVMGAGDYNRVGKARLILRSTAGDLAQWQMNGFTVVSGAVFASPGTAWVPVVK